MAVEFNKRLDEVGNTPLGFQLIPAERKEKPAWILISTISKTPTTGFSLQVTWAPNRQEKGPKSSFIAYNLDESALDCNKSHAGYNSVTAHKIILVFDYRFRDER